MSIQHFYYLMAYFLLYSFLGWVLEVAFHALCKGTIVNRGFLNGPVCPIYGIGMLSVIVLLSPLKHHLFLLFICGTVFATLIELIGGFVLYKLFHMRWWDYSNEPFNLDGYICARFSLAWGFCILFAVLIVHPVVELNVHIMDRPLGYVFVAICYVLFAADCIITVLTVAKLNTKLKRLNRLGTEIRGFSDNLTERIAQKSLDAGAKIQEGRIQGALAKTELEDEFNMLRLQLAEHRHYSYGRLLRAFPDINHREYNDELADIIEYMKKRRAESLLLRREKRKA